uniref:Uncharacterized protein n=1 Tax=Physcomitrium patens TaxID=3218 RepID=A0A2K1JW07_PHYPA|nr:hypothetical protein PHYPA_015481 [Physcomitrium patens]
MGVEVEAPPIPQNPHLHLTAHTHSFSSYFYTFDLRHESVRGGGALVTVSADCQILCELWDPNWSLPKPISPEHRSSSLVSAPPQLPLHPPNPLKPLRASRIRHPRINGERYSQPIADLAVGCGSPTFLFHFFYSFVVAFLLLSLLCSTFFVFEFTILADLIPNLLRLWLSFWFWFWFCSLWWGAKQFESWVACAPEAGNSRHVGV